LKRSTRRISGHSGKRRIPTDIGVKKSSNSCRRENGKQTIIEPGQGKKGALYPSTTGRDAFATKGVAKTDCYGKLGKRGIFGSREKKGGRALVWGRRGLRELRFLSQKRGK